LSKLADDVFAARLVVLDPQPEELDLLSKILNIAQSLNSSNKQLLSSFAYEAAAIILANDPSASPSFFVSTLITLSEILQSLGEHHASLAHLNHLEAIANSSDQLSLIVTYRLQGSAHYELKDFRNSLVCYEKELKVIEELEDSEEKMRLKAENFCHLGSVYHVIGDFHKSISILEDYLKIGRQLQDRKVLSEAHRCLGKAHAMLGNCRQASWHFNTQLNVARKAGNKESQAMALKELGRLHRVLQRPQEAVKCQEQELNVCTSEKMRASCLNLLGLSHYQLKNYDVAMGYYEEARVAAQQIHNKTIEASVCCNISLACHSIGNFLSAVSNLTNALHIAESLQDLVIQLDCHSRLGSFYFGAEKTYLKLAERHLRAAIELFEAMRHDWGSYDRMKTEIIEMPVGVYHKLIHLLVERGETRDALTIAECCLAREYVEKTLCKQDLQSVNAIRQLPAGIMTYDAVTKMVSKINCPVIFYTLTEYGLYIWVLYPGGRGLVKFHHWSKDAVKYLKPFLQQTYQVVSTLPANIPSRVCEPRACPKVTRPVMNGDGSVEVNGGQDDDAPPPPYCSLVSVAHRHGLTYSSVGNDDILHPARSSYLAAPAGEGYATVLRASMRELYDVLVEPIDKHLPQMAEDSNDPVTDLVIVPHGNLYLLPFASLVTSRRTLLSTPYSIRVLPCLQTLRINSQPRARVSQGLQIVQSPTVTSVLVVGNPALPNTVKFHGKSWEPNNLPFAEREAKHVALLLGPGNEALLGRSATRNAVLSKLSQAKVIHVATHGSWEFGAFSVAPSESAVSETEDGEITDKHIVISPSDITKIRLCASLVVLSGYNNVREQDLITADSLLATARSFLTAGAHCVVISMWSPPDRATDEMMFALYEGLQRGLSVAAAVQEGMAHIRSRRGFTDPIHWSGFVVIGENICLSAQNESSNAVHSPWSGSDDGGSGDNIHLLRMLEIFLKSASNIEQFRSAIEDTQKLVSAATSRLSQGRSGQSVALTGFPSTLLQVSGSRELLLALGYSVRYVLVTEDELLVAPEQQMLPMLTQTETCLQTLLILYEAEEEAVNKLLQLFPLQKRYIVGMIHALKYAGENIPDDLAELFGVWSVSECRQFLELFGIQQILGEGGDVLLSHSSHFYEDKTEVAIKCLNSFRELLTRDDLSRSFLLGHSDQLSTGQQLKSRSPSPKVSSMLENFKQEVDRRLQSGLPGNIRPEDKPSVCTMCGVKFSLFRRRYHCRFCDRILCSTCYDTPLPDGSVSCDFKRTPGVCLSCQQMFPKGEY
jgi:CHAT domain-containing protein/tetratricopeptide (TPR) repeat protein